jgi:hypothetical protein
MAECKEGCGRVARSRGMCSSHYRELHQPRPTALRPQSLSLHRAMANLPFYQWFPGSV